MQIGYSLRWRRVLWPSIGRFWSRDLTVTYKLHLRWVDKLTICMYGAHWARYSQPLQTTLMGWAQTRGLKIVHLLGAYTGKNTYRLGTLTAS